MTHNEKVKYMQIASSLCHLHFNDEQIDTLVSVYDLVLKKQGNADMMDVAKVQSKVKARHLKQQSK